MLGKMVKIKVDCTNKGFVSKVGVSVYCGRVISTIPNDIFNIPVYLFTKGDPGTKFNGIIIGILNKESPEDMRFIVAPIGHIYYEPQIREMLSKVRNQSIRSLICRYEKSCGAVVVNGEKENLRVLLVRNKNAMNWGFPKGHIEKGETEYQTALREIKEETGLDVSIIDGFREISDYYSFGNVKKRVVFFLAVSDTKDVTLQLKELNSYSWVTCDQAIKMFEFKNNIIILKRAIYFFNNKKYKYRRIPSIKKGV